MKQVHSDIEIAKAHLDGLRREQKIEEGKLQQMAIDLDVRQTSLDRRDALQADQEASVNVTFQVMPVAGPPCSADTPLDPPLHLLPTHGK